MANVLIVDLLESSAYLVRSLLRGRGHAASIAVCDAEARAKLETGLFDTLVADLCDPSPESLAIVQYANDLLPGMPVVALTRAETEAKIVGVEVFGKFARPIKGTEVNRSVDRAVQHALGLGARRKSPRIDVDYALTVEFGDRKVAARMSDLSPRGFAIDAGSEAAEITSGEGLSGLLNGGQLRAVIQPPKSGKYEVSGRVAFVERGRKNGGRMIGVVFESMGEGTQGWLDSIFAPPAEALAAAA